MAEKKGGDKVLGAYRKLKSDGFRCTLTIIGSIIREPYDEDENLVIIPYLDNQFLSKLSEEGVIHHMEQFHIELSSFYC